MIDILLQNTIAKALKDLYNLDIMPKEITLTSTKKEFEGDFTLVVFPFVKQAKRNPDTLATEVGEYVGKACPQVAAFNVIKGFLNFSVSQTYWQDFLTKNCANEKYGYREKRAEKPVVVEYSSPNTNKPLHLGHIRNNLLGWSVAEILKANGYEVKKVNLVNDRGIHICKSMLAWLKYGNGETPQTSGMKGDHLVGKYYVVYDKEYKKEINRLIAEGMDEETAKQQAPLMLETQDMLRKWEAKDKEVLALWKKMNGWVYEGFDVTYKNLGIDFDKVYYESETYLLGKDLVAEGLQKGVFYKKEDGSVWINLTDAGLDEKLLLRKDGTSVYITQDLGTALLRHKDFDADRLIYVVGNEQNYHFSVLKLILLKLGFQWAETLFHLSYGMVELPSGKMKSREGTVVDADDLIYSMENMAMQQTKEHGRTDLQDNEAQTLYHQLAMGALKYFILKVDPVKNMLFNPEESIDFNGNTGPFIQYTHARICSLLSKAQSTEKEIAIPTSITTELTFTPKELEVIRILYAFPQAVEQSAKTLSPALISNYAYELAKAFNAFYQDTPVLREEDKDLRQMRIYLSTFTAHTIKTAMHLLGIDVPQKM
ncbi:MAG: arginine--tRNA ligase [Bacteroidales bacterium]|jgi:arginyl-tRNA synthetase|nr:arginine--tRNA ligase [Bacteroidales bacterium]